MDGAMGTELQRAGMAPGACYEAWNLTHPERVRAIHAAYVQAGAACLLTNTFQSNPVALARHALDHRLEDINRAAVELARSAAGEARFVLADVGPMAASADDKAVRRTLRSFAGVDGLLLETYSDLAEVLRLLEACRESVSSQGMPVLVSMTYLRTPAGELRTHAGASPETAARALGGVAALGANCGRDVGLPEMAEIVCRYRQVTELPLFARPNAGTPARAGDAWVYPLGPADLAGGVAELLDAGATAVGGCCGTTPGHVAALRQVCGAPGTR
jgi:methionine synthase I (cobalamin-dependent)